MEIFTTLAGQVLVGMLVVINLLVFFVMGRDKRRSAARQDVERTPEGLLFFFATSFGSLGIYLGMYAFRHKTRKWYFQLGIPMLVLQNVATVYVVWHILIV